MAYAKKVSRRRYNRTYRKRYRRRRWYNSRYRRRYRKKYYRKPEYKRIEDSFAFNYDWRAVRLQSGTDANNQPVYNSFIRIPSPYYYYVIGTNPGYPQLGAVIPNGPGPNERIGSKINPARIKFYISMSMMPNVSVANDAPTGPMLDPTQGTTQSYAVRFIVMQVKAGRDNTHPGNQDFSNINPYGTNYADPGFFAKAFVAGGPNIQRYTDNGVSFFEFPGDQLWSYHELMRSPYRRGMGGQFRVLKDKVYTVNTTKSFISFKLKTKKPSRMVWTEIRQPMNPQGQEQNENEYYAQPRNPIYIIAIPVGSASNYHSYLRMTCRYEFLYTDF